MGLIKVALNSAGSVLADQWKEYFYCESLPADVLAVRGRKRTKGGSNHGNDNVISNGSVLTVADGQCMMIVEQGAIVEVCAQPGEYTFDASSESSIFVDGLNVKGIENVLASIGKRIGFGGVAAKDQRIYYFNTKELVGKKYGTPSPVPFRVVDQNIGLDMDISIRCFGEYSYRITNPLLFYTNVCGNISADYRAEELDGQLKTELLTALQPAFARISGMGIRYSELPGHTVEIADSLNEVLSAKWRDKRGLEIVSFGVSSLKADEEDEKAIKELQRNATFRNPLNAAAQLVGAQANAMQEAAKNPNAGPAMAYMGMNMAASAGGMNAQNLFQMGAQQYQGQPGQQYQGQPTQQYQGQQYQGQQTQQLQGMQGQTPQTNQAEQAAQNTASGWVCTACGSTNQGKFCTECGAKKPAGALLYRCDKCGWQPQDPKNPPKFCPECGDPFGTEDLVNE